MEEYTKAGRTIVETCSRLMTKEIATIITDKKTIEIGNIIEKCAENIAKEVHFHVLEEYADRPLEEIPKEIKKDVKNTDVTYYAAQSKPGELQKFRGPLVMLATFSGREIHMPNIEDIIMRTGMQANYFTIASLTYLITGMAINSKTAKVMSPNGTNLKIELSNKLKWVPDTGLLWYKSMWGNLPAGEAFTCPKNVEGIMVVDGILGDFFSEKFGTLENSPLTIPISNSRADIQKIHCENEELLEEFKNYLQQDKNANRVGEFACGTNISLENFVGNLLQDEKFPGVHIAFGSPYPQLTGADWASIGHVDGIMKKCSLWFDDTLIIESGKFRVKDALTLD
ncbi:MAG: aminopeptidase [Promethearchaeota archaeon]